MKRIAMERPAVDYDDNVTEIDEQICALFRQRKDILNNKQAYPTDELLSKWSASFGLYEEFIKTIFMLLMDEEHFRPMVEPEGFRRHIQVLKAVEQGVRLYTLTTVRQYTNASVILLNIDWDAPEDQDLSHQGMIQQELIIGKPYFCRMINGSSNSDHATYKYVVSPPLPDDLSGMEFRFRSNGATRTDSADDDIVFKL
ncbi:hypothetical protein [Paenibacillus sp. FSL R7-0333]|uniref:hypothetical protein n=1 Tax=Paenibacillus sp. FSL R7-0333 TaxID=1926587 RepID=UPI00096C0575|nr:hypothetical protein BK146_00955 [Paenibacillus sp. FSL R7-0333]